MKKLNSIIIAIFSVVALFLSFGHHAGVFPESLGLLSPGGGGRLSPWVVSQDGTGAFVADLTKSLGVATSTFNLGYGVLTVSVSGSTTIQTPTNTTYAFQVLNSALSPVFRVDTINSSTTIS